MNELTAVQRAKKDFPQEDWNTAYPVLPTDASTIESAIWLVVSVLSDYYALVGGSHRSTLLKKV